MRRRFTLYRFGTPNSVTLCCLLLSHWRVVFFVESLFLVDIIWMCPTLTCKQHQDKVKLLWIPPYLFSVKVCYTFLLLQACNCSVLVYCIHTKCCWSHAHDLQKRAAIGPIIRMISFRPHYVKTVQLMTVFLQPSFQLGVHHVFN